MRAKRGVDPKKNMREESVMENDKGLGAAFASLVGILGIDILAIVGSALTLLVAGLMTLGSPLIFIYFLFIPDDEFFSEYF